jgi:hypothetical protein
MNLTIFVISDRKLSVSVSVSVQIQVSVDH